MMEKPFSLFVFGLDEVEYLKQQQRHRCEHIANLTLPNPTDVRDEKVKYNAVIYFDVFVGPDVGSESL
jgi:hypothetical protein